MSSLKDNIFKLGLKLDGIKYAGSIKKIDKRVINKPRKFTPPLSMKFFCKIKRSVVNGFTVYEITPKVKKLNENAIMYIHGGGYILEISVFHWYFIERLAIKCGCKVYVPIYPLATPTYSSSNDVNNLLMELYKNMLKEHKSKNITIIGDSAGATLSLVLGQNIKNSHCEKPNNIIAISPAVDLSIKYDANDKNQIKDDVISPAMITAAKEWFAPKGANLKNYIYSPYYGNSKDIGNITIFISNTEGFYESCLEYHNKLIKENIKHDFIVVPNSYHVSVIFNTVDSRKYFKMIVDKIKS